MGKPRLREELYKIKEELYKIKVDPTYPRCRW